MPATSARQQRFMAMVAHSPESVRARPGKKLPSKEVAREFSHKPRGGYKLKRKR